MKYDTYVYKRDFLLPSNSDMNKFLFIKFTKLLHIVKKNIMLFGCA